MFRAQGTIIPRNDTIVPHGDTDSNIHYNAILPCDRTVVDLPRACRLRTPMR